MEIVVVAALPYPLFSLGPMISLLSPQWAKARLPIARHPIELVGGQLEVHSQPGLAVRACPGA
jgi:hypothetical protein